MSLFKKFLADKSESAEFVAKDKEKSAEFVSKTFTKPKEGGFSLSSLMKSFNNQMGNAPAAAGTSDTPAIPLAPKNLELEEAIKAEELEREAEGVKGPVSLYSNPEITSFLESVEGFETKGYVPQSGGQAIAQSGVTVASGFDLGQQSAESLTDVYGLSDALASKLAPYTGLRKQDAIAKLAELPLQLSEEEAREVNSKVKPVYIAKIEETFNKRTTGPLFNELPQEWQAAIVSVGFQYGSAMKSVPNFLKQVTTGDWKGAHKNLMNFGDQYSNRRKREANLVKDKVSWMDKDAGKKVAAADIQVDGVG